MGSLFPVHRTTNQYQSLSKWLQCWEQVVENAFCSDSTSITDPLTVYTHLIKLVEAAHLVDVREVTHVGECLKKGRAELVKPEPPL